MIKTIAVILTASITLLSTVIGKEAEFNRIRRVHSDNADKLFESAILRKKIIPLHGALARLWLNRDLKEGNKLLQEAHLAIIKHEGGSDTMTSEIASSEHVKWQMRTWNRIYQLFNDKSRFYPGRLDKETQAMIENMFWLYAGKMSNFERAGLQYIWGIHGSENHEMMHYSNALLALQAIKDRPAYRGRKLPDGRSLKQHYEAWNGYYKLYCTERAKHGLQVEVFSAYGKYTMPELFNMADLSEDKELRQKMEKLLHLIWTDWAVGQVKGVRGGGRTRLYQADPKKPYQLLDWGKNDIWRHMSGILLDREKWWNAGQWSDHPIRGMAWILATTQYRLPDVIMDIAKDVEGRGEYVYVARRIAKQHPMAAKEVPVTHSPWYAFDSNDPRMLGYDYCTPDYVMGSLIIDPTLPMVASHTYLQGKDLKEGYPNLNSQNRYHGIVFASDINARVVPQCEGLGNRKTYGQQQAVQHENVMLAQRHKRSKSTGDMRLFFSKGMKARLIEKAGWLVLKEGDTWLGVKGFSQKTSNQSCGYKWDDDNWLRMNDGDAPVALIAGRSNQFPDRQSFTTYLASFNGSVKKKWFTLSSNETKTSLSLHLTMDAQPKVNGKPIDLRPKNVFDCPFMLSAHGSGLVTISKGKRKLVLDFNKSSRKQANVKNAAEKKAFQQAATGNWQQTFLDSCTGVWKENWFLDGEFGTVKTAPDGMSLTAGPEFKNDSHHMVLWTKDIFKGDLKIQYDYTRLDNEKRCVNILYIQASGSGKHPYAKDITKWNELRKVPSMRNYYENMHTYHISYAANPGANEEDVSYIRGRRYMPHRTGLKGTDLDPDYYPKGLFNPSVKHHITVIKKDRDLHMRIQNPEQVYYCHMRNPKLPVITEGRIGIRHMFTRSARYKNFSISKAIKKNQS
jgi:hypothetical protein